MKKQPLIAYLGATATCVGVLCYATKSAKKYGQPLYPKKKLSLEKVGNIANKVLDKVGAK